MDTLKRMGLNVSNTGSSPDSIRRAILCGMFLNVTMRKDNDPQSEVYMTVSDRLPGLIADISTLVDNKFRIIVYHRFRILGRQCFCGVVGISSA